MRSALRALAVLVLTACFSEPSVPLPSAPAEPLPPLTASFSGLIVQEGGLCIPGASVRVVRGQGAGQSIQQETWCDAWSTPGFTFTNLTPGVEMTLLATAPGYGGLEKTVVPDVYSVQRSTLFVLKPE